MDCVESILSFSESLYALDEGEPLVDECKANCVLYAGGECSQGSVLLEDVDVQQSGELCKCRSRKGPWDH